MITCPGLVFAYLCISSNDEQNAARLTILCLCPEFGFGGYQVTGEPECKYRK